MEIERFDENFGDMAQEIASPRGGAIGSIFSTPDKESSERRDDEDEMCNELVGTNLGSIRNNDASKEDFLYPSIHQNTSYQLNTSSQSKEFPLAKGYLHTNFSNPVNNRFDYLNSSKDGITSIIIDSDDDYLSQDQNNSSFDEYEDEDLVVEDENSIGIFLLTVEDLTTRPFPIDLEHYKSVRENI